MTREFARHQIGRFAMLDRYPKTELAALKDLVDALMTVPPDPEGYQPIKNALSPSEATAKAIVDELTDNTTTESKCPTASQVKATVLAKMRPKGTEWIRDPDCTACDDAGEIRTERNGYGYSKPCTCLAWRLPPDYSKLKRAKPFDVSAAVKKVRM